MASKIVRLERLESRVDLDNPFASLTASELLVLIGTYADTYLELAEEPEIIELDEQERRKAEFDTRPDTVAAVAANAVNAHHARRRSLREIVPSLHQIVQDLNVLQNDLRDFLDRFDTMAVPPTGNTPINLPSTPSPG
jgi:hypothetical protein